MTDRWSPDWVVAPGEVLVEVLSERGMSQAELGRRTARPLKTISEIATGKAALTPETAIQFERALGVAASVWLGLEGQYREALARTRDLDDLESQRDWLRRFPVKDLLRRGVLSSHETTRQTEELLQFFGVSSPAGWEQHWGQIAANYRMRGTSHVSPEAVAVWLCLGERDAARQTLQKYDPLGFRVALRAIRPLSRAIVFAAATTDVQVRLEAVGVGFVLIEGVEGAPASGAVRWLGDNPLIELTLRHRADDQFWFSLYHEAGHLLEGGRRSYVVEELPTGHEDPAEEDAANAFAREVLIPNDRLRQFVKGGDFSRSAVKSFAAELEIAPGLVVGRLQRDGVIGPASLNDLKKHLGT